MPQKNFLVYVKNQDSKLINKRLYGIKKFMQDIMLNDQLNNSEDLHYFLTSSDQHYSEYKESMLKRISSDPLSTKLSSVLQADQLINLEDTYLSKVTNPLYKMTSLFYGAAEEKYFSEAQLFVKEKEQKNLQMFKNEEAYMAEMLTAMQKLVERYEEDIEITRS